MDTIAFTHYPNTSHTGDASKYKTDIRTMLTTIQKFYPQRDKYISLGSILRRAFMILLDLTAVTQKNWYFNIYSYEEDSTLNCVLYECIDTVQYYSFFHNRNKNTLAGSVWMEHYINQAYWYHTFLEHKGTPSFRWFYKLTDKTRYGSIIRSTYIDKDKTDKFFKDTPALSRSYVSIRARMLYRKCGIWIYLKYDPEIMQHVYPDCTYGYGSIHPIFSTGMCLYGSNRSLVSTMDKLFTRYASIQVNDIYNCTKLVI